MTRRFIPPGWRLLAQPDFRRLWLAHAGSVVGDGFHAIALTWLVFETLGGGPQALAVLAFAQLVPSLAFGILSGTAVDRLDRRRVMVSADLIRAALVAALAILVSQGLASIPIVIGLGTTLTIAALFFYPARNAVLPAYVAKDDVIAANSLMAATFQAGQLLAPALGGVLFVVIGPVGLLGIDAASFFWSAVLISRMTPGPALPGPAPRKPLLQEAADGLKYIARHPLIRFLIVAGAGNQLVGAGPFRVMLPAWVAFALGAGPPEYGTIMSALFAGTLLANVATSAFRAQLPFLPLIVTGIFIDGLIWTLFAFAPTVLLASIAFFALGMSSGILNLSLASGLQVMVPNEMRGRAFATFSTGLNLTTPLSVAVTGALAATVGPIALIAASGVGLMTVGLVSGMIVLGDRRLRAAPSAGPSEPR
jgi:MFS family permease